MTYQLIALDLDGTLIGADLTITARVRDAVAAARERGVAVTLVTGRVYRSALPFARQLGVAIPLVCAQGAVIRHPVSGELAVHTPLPGPLAAEAVALLHDADVCVIACTADDRFAIVAERADFAAFRDRFHPEMDDVIVAPDLAAVVRATPPTKLMFTAAPEIIARMLATLAARFGGRASVVRSHAVIGEVTAPGLSKAVALADLAARLGVPRAAVLAIGDQENDVPMIEWAGLGLAMGDAPDGVKARADAVIPSLAEDGVAWAIERYVLGGGTTRADTDSGGGL